MNETSPSPLAVRARRFCDPRGDGLPNRRVLLYPLIGLALLFVALVATGVNGTSSGYLHSYFSTSADPALLAGQPQAIRSDEWYVQNSWMISQVEQGFPPVNHTLPGGMDATVQQDLPTTDWSVAFRPQLLGFLFLPLDQAAAFRWWTAPFAMAAAIYLLAVSLLPRRPITSALLSLGFFFAPFMQWWFLSITFWPVAWAALLMAGTVWTIKSAGLTSRIVLPVLVGYTTVTVGMGIYAPFIIATALVALAFVIGFTLTRHVGAAPRFWTRLWKLKWLGLSGAAAIVILVVWLITRWSTIQSFTSTVYPGARLQPVGAARVPDLMAILSGPFSAHLGQAGGVPLEANASESSTFILVGAFLAVPLLWRVVVTWRSRRDWLGVALIGLGLLLIAFIFVPGWDAIAHLLLLDRMTIGRARLALGLLALVITIVFCARLDEDSAAGLRNVPKSLSAAMIVASGLVNGVVAFWLFKHGSALVSVWWIWVPFVILFVAAVGFFCFRRPLLGAAAFAAVSVVSTAFVNPLYVGTYDLNNTQVMRQVKAVAADEPGPWVGVGSKWWLINSILVESGLPAYNGFQSEPPALMWKQIDPHGRYEKEWNRLANVSWYAGTGAPTPSNPQPDQIRMNFDACAAFAQQHVRHVLSDQPLSRCVTQERKVTDGPSTFWLYTVEKK